MNYALAVHGAPYASEAAEHALSFAEAVLASGQSIERVFFFHDGVYQGLAAQVPPQDKFNTNTLKRWQDLAGRGVELGICIASGIKRGIVDESEQARYELEHPTLAQGFELVGLGQLIAAINSADRYVEFPA
ncbi:MAG: sulfurtransferase complex subunit TusD [Gammaproteobacteria bacterium]|jgi:tRNA 2-thiouridine synthesizing protein D